MTDTPRYRDATAPVADRVEDLLKRMTLAEKIHELGNDAPANDRLGIPIMNHGEVLHGVLWLRPTVSAPPVGCRFLSI